MSIATERIGGESPGMEMGASPPQHGSPAPLPVTVIERRHGWHFLDLGELWRYCDEFVRVSIASRGCCLGSDARPQSVLA